MQIYLCDYGCGQEALFVFKNGKRCCHKSKNSCPALRKINSDLHQGSLNSMYGKQHSDETKQKWSQERSGEGNPMYGQKGRISGDKNPRWGKGCLVSGDKNPNWKGGLSKGNLSKYAQGWNFDLKESIRIRDNRTCCLCNNPGKSVHHIDYDKTNHDPKNLVTLCSACHSKTNFNRDMWRNYFETRHNCLYMHEGEISNNITDGPSFNNKSDTST